MAADVKHPLCAQGRKPPKRPSPWTPRHKWRRQTVLVVVDGTVIRCRESAEHRTGIIKAFKEQMKAMMARMAAKPAAALKSQRTMPRKAGAR